MHALRLALVRLYERAFTALMGLLAINALVNLLLYPDRTAVAGLPGPLPWVWAFQYGTGGAFLLLGIMTLRRDFEAAGCLAFMGGALVNALATLAALGSHGWNTVLLLVCFAAAAGARLTQILQRRVIVLLPPPPEVAVHERA